MTADGDVLCTFRTVVGAKILGWSKPRLSAGGTVATIGVLDVYRMRNAMTVFPVAGWSISSMLDVRPSLVQFEADAASLFDRSKFDRKLRV